MAACDEHPLEAPTVAQSPPPSSFVRNVEAALQTKMGTCDVDVGSTGSSLAQPLRTLLAKAYSVRHALADEHMLLNLRVVRVVHDLLEPSMFVFADQGVAMNSQAILFSNERIVQLALWHELEPIERFT
jgi:hypothetical protein